MKAKTNLFWVVSCILLAASGSVTAVDGSGLVGHWKFDEGEGSIAYDSAGDNDGTIYGAEWAIGQADGALDFDGVDDYVEVSSPGGLNFGSSTDFTFAAWIRAREMQLQFPAIIGRRNPGDGAGYIFFVNSYTGGELAVQLNDGTWTNYMATSGDLQDDTWHHVAASADRDGYLTLYVDAVQKGQYDISDKGNINSTSNVFIGWEEQNPAVTYFNGTIDDVRIYDRALSAEEIWQLYLNGVHTLAVDIKPATCPNPLNVASRGVLPVAVLGAEDFDVNAIDIASIRLAGVAPIRSSYEDVAAPLVDGNECECTTEGPDGYTDLILKFKTPQIVEALVSQLGDLVDREVLALTLEGALSDGPLIVGEDCIAVLGKVPKSIIAKRSDLNEDGIINMVDLTIMVDNWLEAAAVDDF